MKKLNITNKVGILGEKIAGKYLMNKGYKILATNYLEKTGEIDIIATKNKSIHFCEVKSRSVSSLEGINDKTDFIFNNIHAAKLKRFQKTVLLYLMKQNISHKTSWQIDIIGVYIDHSIKKAKVVVIENVV